jgi:hypothetical protein
MIAFFMKILDRSWLARVYKVNRLLFFIVTLFFAGTICANLIRLQATPFFVWDMYSGKIPEVNAYPYLEIRYNHNQVINIRHTWNEPLKTYLYDPLRFYAAGRARLVPTRLQSYLENGWPKRYPWFAWLDKGVTITRSKLDAYPAWLNQYLSTVTGQDIYEVTALKKMVKFNAAGMPVVISSDTILHIP